jgi:hypothetical protein
MKKDFNKIAYEIAENVTKIYLDKIKELDQKTLEENIFSITGICCTVFIMSGMNFLLEVLKLRDDEAREMSDTFLYLLEEIYQKYYERGTL